MTAARTPDYVPYDVFLRMEAASDGRHEWVDGVVYAMTRGTPEHGRLTNRVVRALVLADGCESFSGEAIVNPSLVVEILSDATERYDRDAKFEAYEKLPSLREYVLVSQKERRIEVRTRADGEWKTRVALTAQSIAINGEPISVDTIYG